MASMLPNPDTYLNHLQPDIAREFEITRNVYLAILGASIWDVLVYIPDDIRIVARGFAPVTFCFVFSRVFAITYALLFVLVQTRPIANCAAMSISMGIVCLLAMGCTSFLFLQRLHVVYSRQRMVRWLFSFLWFGVTAMTVTVVIGVGADHIEGTGYCIMYQIHSYTSVSEFLPVAFDTLVFFAISYRLISDQVRGGVRTKWGSFFYGNMEGISRVLLREGQQYYITVFWMMIASGAVLYAPSVPVIYRPMLTLASTTLVASTACRVFRNLKKFGYSAQASDGPKISDIRFARSSSHGSESHQLSLPQVAVPPSAQTTTHPNDLIIVTVQQ